jgi:hypothetical protein
MSLHFGKYKGRPIRDVDGKYLNWLIQQHWINPETEQEARAELYRRRHTDELRESRKVAQMAADESLLKAGWLISGRGHYSRWFVATAKRPGWACYQVSHAVARLVQDYLDQEAEKHQQRRSA